MQNHCVCQASIVGASEKKWGEVNHTQKLEQSKVSTNVLPHLHSLAASTVPKEEHTAHLCFLTISVDFNYSVLNRGVFAGGFSKDYFLSKIRKVSFWSKSL